MVRIATYTTLFALAASNALAFVPANFNIRTIEGSSTARRVLLSEEETESIFKTATDCAEGECSVDDVGSLIAELKGQQTEMTVRLNKIMKMVADLENINEQDERKVDEVRQYVQDLLRVFGPNSRGFATGFSGDIGDGPTTAYDALDPLPYKKK